jgi:hypothetical protein
MAATRDGADRGAAHHAANSGSALAAAVASGAMDFGRGTILPLISAYARGVSTARSAGRLSEPFMSLALHSGKARYFGNVVGALARNLIESAWYTNAGFAAKNRVKMIPRGFAASALL